MYADGVYITNLYFAILRQTSKETVKVELPLNEENKVLYPRKMNQIHRQSLIIHFKFNEWLLKRAQR